MDKKKGLDRWDPDERKLMETFAARRRDREQLKSRRQKSLDAPLKPLESIIQNYFKTEPQTLKKIEESRALVAWEEMVGGAATRVSKAIKIRGNQLVVRVSDPLWMAQLTLLKREIIKKYQVAFPKLGIRDIFFTR